MLGSGLILLDQGFISAVYDETHCRLQRSFKPVRTGADRGSQGYSLRS